MASWMAIDQQVKWYSVEAARSAAAAVSLAPAQPAVLPLSGETALGAAARVLGLTVTELSDQLWAGARLDQLAAAAHLPFAAVEAAVLAATLSATRLAITHGAAEGTLSPAHARWLREGLDAGYWGGPGDAFGLDSAASRGPEQFGGTHEITLEP